MIINLNVKIKGGPRTPIDVTIYGTAVNSKIMRFKNGKSISENAIAEWLEENLLKALSAIQNEGVEG